MSVKTFENHTVDLTERELDLVLDIRQYLRDANRIMGGMPVRSKALVKFINNRLYEAEIDMQMTDCRLRKFVNHLRSNGLLPIIATNKGYCLARTRAQIVDQIESLRNRANAINAAASGLQEYLNDTYGIRP